MKPKLVYHGSTRKIKGNKLLPKQAKDVGNASINIHKGIYASNLREIAIAAAIVKSKGVRKSSLTFNKKPWGTILKGKPQQKYIYLYTLPAKTFRLAGQGGRQWVSSKPVKPIKEEKLAIRDYLYLIKIF